MGDVLSEACDCEDSTVGLAFMAAFKARRSSSKDNIEESKEV